MPMMRVVRVVEGSSSVRQDSRARAIHPRGRVRARNPSGGATTRNYPHYPQNGAGERLAELPSQLERLGIGGRTDPEAIVVGKVGIAAEPRRLAWALAP